VCHNAIVYVRYLFLPAKPLASTKVMRKSKSKLHESATSWRETVSTMNFSMADKGFSASMLDKLILVASQLTKYLRSTMFISMALSVEYSFVSDDATLHRL
jgi:hypothetical protein